jgi:hypothetical protein
MAAHTRTASWVGGSTIATATSVHSAAAAPASPHRPDGACALSSDGRWVSHGMIFEMASAGLTWNSNQRGWLEGERSFQPATETHRVCKLTDPLTDSQSALVHPLH